MKKYMAWFFGILMILAGINHFASPQLYIKIMPSYLPWHYGLVVLSGIIEVGLGIGFLFSKTRKVAGWGIIALLIAIFPANIYMAQHWERFPEIPLWGLYVRLPIQVLLGIWVWWLAHERVQKASAEI